jgi:hypothetical protein
MFIYSCPRFLADLNPGVLVLVNTHLFFLKMTLASSKFFCMQHNPVDGWVGSCSPKQLVLNCSYQSLPGQVWNRCTLKLFCHWTSMEVTPYILFSFIVYGVLFYKPVLSYPLLFGGSGGCVFWVWCYSWFANSQTCLKQPLKDITKCGCAI